MLAVSSANDAGSSEPGSPPIQVGYKSIQKGKNISPEYGGILGTVLIILVIAIHSGLSSTFRAATASDGVGVGLTRRAVAWQLPPEFHGLPYTARIFWCQGGREPSAFCQVLQMLACAFRVLSRRMWRSGSTHAVQSREMCH